MKFLVILLILLLVLSLIALRYRKQIQMGLYMWRMFKKMREMNKTDEKQLETTEISTNSPLVKCSNCGIWLTQKKALNLRSKTYYCSTECMEKAVSSVKN